MERSAVVADVRASAARSGEQGAASPSGKAHYGSSQPPAHTGRQRGSTAPRGEL